MTNPPDTRCFYARPHPLALIVLLLVLVALAVQQLFEPIGGPKPRSKS